MQQSQNEVCLFSPPKREHEPRKPLMESSSMVELGVPQTQAIGKSNRNPEDGSVFHHRTHGFPGRPGVFFVISITRYTCLISIPLKKHSKSVRYTPTSVVYKLTTEKKVHHLLEGYLSSRKCPPSHHSGIMSSGFLRPVARSE